MDKDAQAILQAFADGLNLFRAEMLEGIQILRGEIQKIKVDSVIIEGRKYVLEDGYGYGYGI